MQQIFITKLYEFYLPYKHKREIVKSNLNKIASEGSDVLAELIIHLNIKCISVYALYMSKILL